jgi:uncharacterized protein YggU (UPF0235/DUF167 family)
MSCYRRESDGIVAAVRLTPKGGTDAVQGRGRLADGREVVLARVRAVPEKGAANAALERLMADHFGIAKSAVAVASGATSRIKQVRLSGDPQRLADAIDRLPELKG